MVKQQVRVCDTPGCEEHRGVTTWVMLKGAQPRRADYCPQCAEPYEKLWGTMPVPQERRFGRRTEVVSIDDVIAARLRGPRKPPAPR